MKRFAAGVIALLSPFALLGASQTSKLEWRSIGPYIGGRVVAVAGVPDKPNLFYMGGVQGGIWKSTDYGSSWTNISDGELPNVANSIGALAVAPSNPKIIYAGTGESDIRGDFDTGDGIYKSTDGGDTWHYAGLRDTHTTTSIVIDPRNPNIVYASSLGHVFAPNTERGVYKTVDGGKTWKKVLFVDRNTGADVVVMDAKNPSVLYAATWQAQRMPWNLTSGGPGSAIYKTVDAGAHWTKISNHPGFATGTFGKIGIAVAASNPNVVYAIVQAKDGGVFRSDDAGSTWKRVNAEWKLRQRAFYYMAIYVDPTNAKVAYAPNVDGVWKTTDSGKTWKALNPPHGDCHIVWINPKNPQIILEGDDGGATVSVNGGDTWSSDQNQPTGQFYHIAVDNQFPYHVYGAQQDEGAVEGASASNEGLPTGYWHSVALGESTFVAVDPRDPNITYGSGYFSSLAQFNTPNGEEKNVTPWAIYLDGADSSDQKYRFGWTHPILFSPAKPDELFETAQVVFKSDDFGKTWNVISPDLTRNDKATEGPTGGPVYNDQTGVETFPDISSFAISPLNADVMWAGSADGLVHVTTDAGTTWKLITPPALPQWAQISSIEPSHSDAGTAFLTASRYQWDDFHPYIYKTTDYGAHWTTMTNGLPPDQYVFVVREDPRDGRVLFAGTRSNVYVSLNAGATWQDLTLKLPGAQVRDIAISAKQGQVAIATHGRAFWILDNLAFLEQLASGKKTLYEPETAWLTHAYGGGGGGTNSGTNPDYGATVFFNIPKGYNGKTPVTLSFLDDSGKTVRSFTLHLKDKHAKKLTDNQRYDMDSTDLHAYDLRKLTAIEPGINKFVWDMRYTPPTEIRGAHAQGTDDFSDEMQGPTILPGTYTVVLDYGGAQTKVPLAVSLDPRIHPQTGDLEARLALASQVAGTLDELNRTVNAAEAARGRVSPANRAQIDDIVKTIVDFTFSSSEADVMRPGHLRDHLAFVMNELDLAYQPPTAAETAAYQELKARADDDIAKLKALTP